MVNCVMLASETPNKSNAIGFAATNRRSRFVTTTASTGLDSNSRKSFSLSRRASCRCRVFSRTFFPLSVSGLSACRRWRGACFNVLRNCETDLVILPFTTRAALRKLASISGIFWRAPFPRSASGFSACRRWSAARRKAKRSRGPNLTILAFASRTASREPASSSRIFSTAFLARSVNWTRDRRRCSVACSKATKRSELNLVTSIKRHYELNKRLRISRASPIKAVNASAKASASRSSFQRTALKLSS